ncbi:hypothetical protein AB434_2824 [Heyndrickxia coagulans]|uniref:Uncharacterized protein n=1 Tax=Heyndrickxia coagulans TaxID=1398 RepID=A0A0C5C8R8_HEYCO|nr:hypothetical protein SB48_HM08orf03937 [Heyndrickxia coagulans]AKN55229.1 hypothetical protein AB434_2824 [Heyndrickxia coagulans]KWZ76230.1 hypothetical protein HMPREF3213_03983 [Heyndrickxia coagulans]KYC59164.1 hypothetical protein B4100_3665 [Heyndrickxia coagulans]KYC89727.1 hypothetical protein B4096_3669 [Heyndrickxia coagulans]
MLTASRRFLPSIYRTFLRHKICMAERNQHKFTMAIFPLHLTIKIPTFKINMYILFF